MATIELSDPPDLGAEAKYGDYKPWLLENFYKNLCSYCLQQYGALSIEHYVPQSHARSLTHEPTNLLLGCPNCQRKKWDYHPEHTGRRCKKHDKTGHLVLDVRSDDLSEWFEIRGAGELSAKSGPQQDRAVWNAQLLRLDLYDEEREALIEKMRSVEGLLQAISDGEVASDARVERVLDVLVSDLAERRPFIVAFGLEVSAALLERIDAKHPH